MTFMAKNMASLDDNGKSLYFCVLRRGRRRSRKSLIDMRMQWSCIPLAGIELYKNTLKSEKTNPFSGFPPAQE